MIVRLVHLKVATEKVEQLFTFLAPHLDNIRNAPGCSHLDILQDIHDKTVITTYSIWNSEDDLNNYRNSPLFAIVWPGIKACLSEPAKANSYDRKINLF